MHARRLAALAALLAAAAAAAWLLFAGEPAGEGPAAQGSADFEVMEIDSAATDAAREVGIATPGSSEEGRPMLVFLHGRGGDAESELDNQALFDAMDELGDRAPVVAFPDGGGSSYWHDRASGDWGRYVLEEVIPAVASRTGADPERVAIGGISMGGFGALDLARLEPGRFCAVGAHSPAIWQNAEETAPGAFDDAQDFAEHDLVGTASAEPGRFEAQPMRLDAADADPFLPGLEAFAGALEAGGVTPVVRIAPGGHDDAYWQEHWDEYMRFYARELDRCER